MLCEFEKAKVLLSKLDALYSRGLR